MNDLKKINIQYKALHGFYWMLYGLPTGYITVVLLAQGFSSSVIGAIVAASNIIAAIGQLIVGDIADHHPKATWKNLTFSIGALETVTLGVLLIFQHVPIVTLICFPTFMLLVFFQMPLVNSSIFYYTAQGLPVDFGSARGTGSVTYAVITFIAGQMIARISESIVIFLSLAVLLGLMTITGLMPCTTEKKLEMQRKENKNKRNDSEAFPQKTDSSKTIQNNACAASEKMLSATVKSRQGGGIIIFAKRYPGYVTVLIGIILLMAFHNISHTYMIQIMEAAGGNSATMGTAFSIEALAELPIMFGFYKLMKRFSPDSLMRFCAIAFIAKAAFYLLAGSVTALYLTQLLQMFSYAIFASASVYYANEKMDASDKITGQSYMTAAISIGAVLGNLSGGIVFDALGTVSLLIFSLILTIAGAGITALGIQQSVKK